MRNAWVDRRRSNGCSKEALAAKGSGRCPLEISARARWMQEDLKIEDSFQSFSLS